MTILRQPWRWMPFRIRLWAARVRTRVRQHNVLRTTSLVGVVAVSALVLVGARARASAAQEMWGNAVSVFVVSESVSAGDEFYGRLDSALRPEAFLPNDAIRSPLDREALAARSLEPGDIVTYRDLVSSGHTVQLEAGRRAVSLPTGPGIPLLHVGDRVELHIVFDTYDHPGEPVLIDSAVVVDVGAEDVTIAVDARDVPTVAQASTSGQVIVARR